MANITLYFIIIILIIINKIKTSNIFNNFELNLNAKVFYLKN